MPSPTRISVFAKPNAKQSRITRVDGTQIDVALSAPPVDGAANAELVRFLAEVLSVPKSALTLARGAGGRRKLVEISSLEPGEVIQRLAASAKTP